MTTTTPLAPAAPRADAAARPPSRFDRFAGSTSEFTGHAIFFIACLLLVVLWLPSFFLIGDLNTWQLIINTITTIVTFLLVALLQNSQRRGEKAMHEKLDALADGLADLMEKFAHDDPDLRADMEELRRCVGIENGERNEIVVAGAGAGAVANAGAERSAER